MNKRKYKDNYTGVDKSESVPDIHWSRGGSSGWALKFYAVLKSSAYYETPDDNRANFRGCCETTPKFDSLDELQEYLDDNKICIGSMIKKVVPINDWEHKPYKRTVYLPITSITIMSVYTVNHDVCMRLKEIRANAVYENDKFNGDEKKLQIDLHRSFLQDLYSQVMLKRRQLKSPDQEIVEVPINISDMLEVFRILGLETGEKKEQCNTISEEEK
jgi:hypothetical protein